MESILFIRHKIIELVKKHERALIYLTKFLYGFILITLISKLGTASIISRIYIRMFLALIIMLSPFNVINLLTILVLTVQIFFSSVELSIFFLVTLLLVFLFYARMFPKESMFIVLLPLAFYFKIPYLIPLLAGVYFGISSLLPVLIGLYISLFGTVINGFLANTVSDGLNIDGISSTFIELYTLMIEQLSQSPEFLILAISFSLAIIIIYVFNTYALPYVKQLSMIFAAIIMLVANMVLAFNSDRSFVLSSLSLIFSLVIALVLSFFDIMLDYRASKKLRFNDGENFYYVSIIPIIKEDFDIDSKKNTVFNNDKNDKNILIDKELEKQMNSEDEIKKEEDEIKKEMEDRSKKRKNEKVRARKHRR